MSEIVVSCGKRVLTISSLVPHRSYVCPNVAIAVNSTCASNQGWPFVMISRHLLPNSRDVRCDRVEKDGDCNEVTLFTAVLSLEEPDFIGLLTASKHASQPGLSYRPETVVCRQLLQRVVLSQLGALERNSCLIHWGSID